MYKYLLALIFTTALSAQGTPAGPLIHSVTDISHEFTFYFDGRFGKNYIKPCGGRDCRNWATLYKYDFSRVNLLVLQSGASPCPYLPKDIGAIKKFLATGGGVVILGDHARFQKENEYGLNRLAQAFGAEFLPLAATKPLRSTGICKVNEIEAYRGKTLGLTEPDLWEVIVRDGKQKPVMARRRLGKGSLLITSRALSGRQPNAKDPINQKLWQTLLRDLVRGKVVSRKKHPQSARPELELTMAGLKIKTSEYLRPYAEAIIEIYKAARPKIEEIMGVPPNTGMLSTLILLPTGGGGFSSGHSIGLGVWWGNFPTKKYGMIELLGHEATHSWVLPFAEPLWNEGIATYVGALLGEKLGHGKEGRQTLQRWIRNARKHDPEMKKFDLTNRKGLPHNVAMAKPMWIWEQLRAENPDILARYFQTKRRLIDPKKQKRFTPHDSVAILSIAMGRDLFPWFRSLNIQVDKTKTKLTVPRGKSL